MIILKKHNIWCVDRIIIIGCIHLSIPQHAISPGFIKYHVLVLYLVYRIAGIVKIGNVILWNWLDVSLLYRKAVSISSAGGFCYPLLYKFHTQASIFVSTPTLTNRIFKPFFDGVQIYFCTPILVYKFVYDGAKSGNNLCYLLYNICHNKNAKKKSGNPHKRWIPGLISSSIKLY